jgi:hypothetical protein
VGASESEPVFHARQPLALSIAATASKMLGAIFMALSPESDRRAESPRILTL